MHATKIFEPKGASGAVGERKCAARAVTNCRLRGIPDLWGPVRDTQQIVVTTRSRILLGSGTPNRRRWGAVAMGDRVPKRVVWLATGLLVPAMGVLAITGTIQSAFAAPPKCPPVSKTAGPPPGRPVGKPPGRPVGPPTSKPVGGRHVGPPPGRPVGPPCGAVSPPVSPPVSGTVGPNSGKHEGPPSGKPASSKPANSPKH